MNLNQIIPRDRHSWLLRKERILQENEFEEVLKTNSVKLREEGELFLGKYLGFDDKRGNLLVWFPANAPLPRKGEPLVAFIPEPALMNPANWGNLTYEKLRASAQCIIELSPVWLQKNTWRDKPGFMVGLKGVSEAFRVMLPDGANLCFGPAEPPIEYLENLYQLTTHTERNSPSGRILDLSLDQSNWNPEPIVNDAAGILRVQTELLLSGIAVVQGPPGTGKTHLTADLCALFIKQGKKVLVTALTNRALIELAGKEPLKEAKLKKQVFKTNLTEDEKREVKGLEEGKDYDYSAGSLLLQTYYLMSRTAVKATSPQFDVVIVEEASQAFLSTIAAAHVLAQNLLLIGDQAQLPPIMVAETEISKEDLNNLRFAKNGLSTICDYYKSKTGFILTHSRRLPERAVRLTNHFYEGQLSSLADLKPPFVYNLLREYSSLMHQEGGTTLLPLALPKGDRAPALALEKIAEIVTELHRAHPELHISVLSHYRATVRALQKKIYSTLQSENILVETIARIQGLTTDICFYLVVNDGVFFQTQDPLFNVVTSRARRNTVIVCSPDLLSNNNLAQKVSAYLKDISL